MEFKPEMQGSKPANDSIPEPLGDLEAAMDRMEGVRKEVDQRVKESYDSIREAIAELSRLRKRPLAEVILEIVKPWEKEIMFSRVLAIPANRRKSKGEPRYRHPLDASITWSGAGKRPEWFIAYRNNGGNVEDLAISPGQLSAH